MADPWQPIADALNARVMADLWLPISTAPVPPREVLRFDQWRCLLQDKKGWVQSGYGAYTRMPGVRVPKYRLQWYCDHGNPRLCRVFPAVYWMPLPAAKEV